MGIFGSRRKFSDMQTPEEQYRASGAYQAQERATRARSAERTAKYRREQRQEREQAATEERRKQVTRAGTLRRRGNELVIEGGWRFATDKLPLGRLPKGMRFGETIAGLTPKDLHDLATNHGPNCRCGLGR